MLNRFCVKRQLLFVAFRNDLKSRLENFRKMTSFQFFVTDAKKSRLPLKTKFKQFEKYNMAKAVWPGFNISHEILSKITF